MQFIETIQTLHNRLHPHQDLLDRIVAAQAWAKQRLDQPITLNEMAAYACVSPFYFIRQFKAHTGCSPSAWQEQRTSCKKVMPVWPLICAILDK
jgi:transcriptional regulator GlxA family with amidase domain